MLIIIFSFLVGWKIKLSHLLERKKRSHMISLATGQWVEMTGITSRSKDFVLRCNPPSNPIIVRWRNVCVLQVPMLVHLLCHSVSSLCSSLGDSVGLSCSANCYRVPTMRETGFNTWKISWRRKQQPAPVLLPAKSHGQRSLVGYSPWGRKEVDMTEQLHFHFSLYIGKYF